MLLRLGGINDVSTIDWYGNVSMGIFLAGCNLRCKYCQNSGLLPIDSGKEVDLELIRDRIKVNRAIMDAVVIMGGEPLVQPDATIEVARIAKDYGLKVMLNTNGSIRSAAEKVLASGFIDRLALDVVAPLRIEAYEAVTGARNPEVIESVKYCILESKRLGIPLEARTTVAPGLTDEPEAIKEIASYLKGYSEVYYLQQYDNQGEVLDQNLKQKQSPSREKMMTLAHAALSTGLRNVFVKTRTNGLEKVG